MQYLDVLLALAALLCLCRFFYKSCGMNAALTPLAAISATMIWTSIAGVAGVLYPAVWVYYILCFGLGIYTLFDKKTDGKREVSDSPGFWFFLAASLICFVYFAVRKPIFSEWDEVSFWGTAAKLMKLNNSIYTTAEIAWDWIPSQMPGLISFSYFLQFFGAVFAPWKVLLAYNIVFFAMFAAMIACFDFKKYSIALPVCVIGLLTPYFLTVYTRIIETSHIYLCSYGDIPAGMMFGAVMCWYFAWRSGTPQPGKYLPRGFFGLLLVLAASSLFKDNTFVVELVGAGIIAADFFFFGPGYGDKTLRRPKKWGMRISYALACFAAPIVTYAVWNRHIAILARQREAVGETGSTSLPLTEVVRRGFMMLFAPETRSERFTHALNSMGDAFFTSKLSAIGPGVVVTAVILAIFLFAGITAADGLHRRRVWVAMGLSTCGFIGYYWVLTLSYAFIFREMDALGLASYNRYVQSYYLGWFMLAVMMLALSARSSRPYGLAKGGLLALSCAVLLCVAYLVNPRQSVLAYSDSHFYAWKRAQTTAQEIRDTIPNDGKIFYVRQTDNGLEFFKYCYELLPYQMDLSFGGGEIGLPENNVNGNIYYHDYYLPKGAKKGEEKPLDFEGLSNYLREHECKYIFTDQVDGQFCEVYGGLFTDDLEGAQDGSVLIYRRVSESPLQYEPVPRPAKEAAAP